MKSWMELTPGTLTSPLLIQQIDDLPPAAEILQQDVNYGIAYFGGYHVELPRRVAIYFRLRCANPHHESDPMIVAKTNAIVALVKDYFKNWTTQHEGKTELMRLEAFELFGWPDRARPSGMVYGAMVVGIANQARSITEMIGVKYGDILGAVDIQGYRVGLEVRDMRKHVSSYDALVNVEGVLEGVPYTIGFLLDYVNAGTGAWDNVDRDRIQRLMAKDKHHEIKAIVDRSMVNPMHGARVKNIGLEKYDIGDSQPSTSFVDFD